MKLGLAGYPQVGKKTLFRLLTGQAEGGRQGLAPVRDPRFERLVGMYSPRKETPAQMEFVLLPDLDEEPQRNAEALKALEDVDVICHLVRAFADESVYHISGSVDPERDMRRFADELLFNDLAFVDKRQERLEREQRAGKDARAAREAELLARVRAHLEGEEPLARFSFSAEEEKLVASYPFLTRKKIIQVLNLGEEALAEESLQKKLAENFAPWNFAFFAVSARIEEELAQLDEPERSAFLADLGLESPALDRLTQLCYESLGLISFFTVGEDEVRAWTIRRGALAPQAGRAIHSDIERGFIRAEVMKYGDLVGLGDEAMVKSAGRLLQKGRDYQVEDGDVMHFLFKV